MSLDVDRALTGGNITKSTVSDFICDPDTCLTLNILQIFADIIDMNVYSAYSVDPSQEQKRLGQHCLCLPTSVIYAADDINI